MTNSDKDNIDLAELARAEISRRVAESMDEWRWNRDAAVALFPPAVQQIALDGWEPGNL